MSLLLSRRRNFWIAGIIATLVAVLIFWQRLATIFGVGFFILLFQIENLKFPSDRTVRETWSSKQTAFDSAISMLRADSALDHPSADCRFDPKNPQEILGLNLSQERRAQYGAVFNEIPKLDGVNVYKQPQQILFVLGRRGLAINWGGLKGICYIPDQSKRPYSKIVKSTDGLRIAGSDEGSEYLVPLDKPGWFIFLW